jgi:hypothetical protein
MRREKAAQEGQVEEGATIQSRRVWVSDDSAPFHGGERVPTVMLSFCARLKHSS